MENLHNYDEVGLVCAISGGQGPLWFVQFAQAKFGVKVGAGCTAVSAPDFYPYFETGQFSGILGGMKGAAEYEQLVEERYGTKAGGARARGWAPSRPAHLAIMAFVILGNMAYFAGQEGEVMHLSHDIWMWVGVFLTLSVLSFLYRDNPFYRFAEHLWVGVANGYSIAFMYHRVIMPVMLKPLGQAFQLAAKKGVTSELFNPLSPANFWLIVPG